MSTDKTLADVKPGGMVRLGDQAERARFEAWAESAGYALTQEVGQYVGAGAHGIPDEARQPVGEPVAWMIERLRGKGYGRDKYVVMKGQASSDPDSHLFWADQQARDNHLVTPLYAAQPAQAVDLGRFRKLASWVANCAGHGINDSQRRLGEELLALIDSQTAGK